MSFLARERVSSGSHRRRSRGAASLLIALGGGAAIVSAASPAAAQASSGSSASSDDPRVLLDRALADFRAGNFRPALQRFQRTYELTGNPAILFNIAVTWQRLGEPGEGARTLRRFLVAQPQAPNRAEIERQIATLEAEEANLHHSTPVATTSSAPPHEAPIPTTSNAPTRESPIATTSNAPTSETPVSSSAVPSNPQPVVSAPTRSIVGPVAVMAAGGAAVVTGAVFLGLREMAIADLRTMCNTTTDPWICHTSARGRYDDAATFTTVSIVTGIVGALAIAGGVTWLLLPGNASRRDSARIGFGASGDGASMTIGGAF